MQHSLTETDLQFLSRNKLFEGIRPAAIENILISIMARKIQFYKDNIMVAEGEPIREFGLLLSGRAIAYKSEPGGKKFIISNLERGNVFGNILSISAIGKSPVTVVAESDAQILLIPAMNIVDNLAREFDLENRLLKNLLNIMAEKFFELQERINCIIQPTLQKKILYYLSGVSTKPGAAFTIPFNRQELAEYLNAERSALSRELSAMKKEGIIDYYHNSFRII